MIRFFVFLSLFISAQAFAVELDGKSQSEISSMPIEIDGEKVVAGGFGGGFGTSVGGTGMGGFYAPSSKIKFEVNIMKNAVSVGKNTIEVDGTEASRMSDNIYLLNQYMKKGGSVDISANPSAQDLSKAVQKISTSNDLKTVRLFHEIETDKLKAELAFYKTSCGGMMGGGFGSTGSGFGSRGSRSRGIQNTPKTQQRSAPATR